MTEQSEILMLELLRQVDGKVDTLSEKVDKVISVQSTQGATLANHEARLCTLEKDPPKETSASSTPATPKTESAQPSPWIPVVQSVIVWVARIVLFLLSLLAFLFGVKEIFTVVKFPLP